MVPVRSYSRESGLTGVFESWGVWNEGIRRKAKV
jgi:hypothetical protein